MISENEFFTLAVSVDKSKAILALKYDSSLYSKEIELIYKQVLNFLNQSGVIFGILKSNIMQNLSKVQAERKETEAFVCARGQPVINSKPYEYKFYVEMQKENFDRWLASGSSYAIVKSLTPVKSKDVILDILPGERGIEGINVFGETIKPKMFPIIKIEAGLNVKDFNHQRYTALTDGIVQVERNYISVLPFEEMRLIVDVSEDGMQAFLSVQKSGQKILPPSEASILKALHLKKISTGINKEALFKILEVLQDGSYSGEKVLIAEGKTPIHGSAASFFFYFKINKEKVDFPAGFVQCDESHDDLFHRDQLVAEKTIPEDEEDGYTVTGIKIKARQKQDFKLNIEQNFVVKEDKEKKKQLYYATVGGHVSLNGRTLFLEPYENASFKLKIQEDATRALIDFYPAKGGGKKLNIESIYSELNLEHINFGLKEDVLKNAVREVNENEKTIKNLLIAEFLPAKNGEDGRLDLFFKTTSNLVVDDDVRIDFKQRESIPYIEAEKLMARIIEPTKGEPGKNIKSEIIEPRDGIAVVPKLGNTVEQKGNEIFAKISGWPIYRNNTIDVLPYFETEGDVSYATGNIAFHGTVMVKGDVQTGFSVEATNGDVIVAGNCNQGHLKATGNIIVKGGVIKSEVDAKGDFTAKFAEYSHLRVFGNIHILASSLQNIILCKKNVFVNKGKGIVLGGKIFAQASIQCLSSGNDAQTETLLFAGEDFFAKQKQRTVKKDIQKLLEEKNNLEIFLQETSDEKVKKKVSLLQHQLRRLNLLEQSLSNRIQFVHLEQGSFVYVKSDIFAGTIITVKEKQVKLKTSTKNMLFHFNFDKDKLEQTQQVKELPKIVDADKTE